MDVGQGAITIDSMEATLVTNTSQGTTETSGNAFSENQLLWKYLNKE